MMPAPKLFVVGLNRFLVGVYSKGVVELAMCFLLVMLERCLMIQRLWSNNSQGLRPPFPLCFVVCWDGPM